MIDKQISDLKLSRDEMIAQLKPLWAERGDLVNSGDAAAIFEVHAMNIKVIRPIEEKLRSVNMQIASLESLTA